MRSSKRTSSGPPDYNYYLLDPPEKAFVLVTGIGTILVISWLFYNSFFFTFLLSPYLFWFYKKRRKKKYNEQKWQLNLQFADALKSLSAALEAGYSVENGLAEAYRDLLVTYKENDLIMMELRLILANLRNGMSIEEAIRGFSKRSGLEDAESFTDVFAAAQRTGGNIIAVIRSTTDVIRTRIDIKREVRTATASAKYESDIMKVVPFGVLLYLRIFSAGMITPLYGTLKGIVFMTVILTVYVILCEISDRMVRIEL